VDVIVVGSGAGGATAALAARWAGAGDVLLLEKEALFGGTTGKSGGTFWIPNNTLLQKEGVHDEKEPTLRFMAKLSYPEKYDPSSPKLGLDELEYGWLSQYYDLGSKIVAEMEERGVIQLAAARFRDGKLASDYNYDPEMPVREGKLLGSGMPGWQVGILNFLNGITKRVLPPLRTMIPFVKEILFLEEFALDISYGIGLMLCQKLRAGLKKEGVRVEMGHAVDALLVEGDRARGVRVQTSQGEKVIEARMGVVFGSGGFAHSKELRQKYMPQRPIDGTAASKGNDGIMIHIAQELGLNLVHMDRIWGAQCLTEESQQTFETESCIFICRGDSAILVNREGRRIMNEKNKYDNRVRPHWQDGNRFLLLVADKRCVDLYGMDFAKSLPASPNSKFYIKGSSVAAFTAAARDRVKKVAAVAGESFTLSDDFEKGLEDSINKFNSFAKSGKDLDFHRGEEPSELQWHYKHASGGKNPTMFPIDSTDLYGVIVGPQATDTKGGPQIDLQGRCLRGGQPFEGLYACGNASGAISGDAYWSGGVPIGSAIITGYIAGKNVASQIRSRL